MADHQGEGRGVGPAPDPFNPGIEVDGERLQFPTFDTITIDEERLLYVYSETVVRDFIPAHPEATDEEKEKYRRLQALRVRDPDFKKGLAVIALRRAYPDMPDDERAEKAGRVNALEADIAMLWGEDQDPQQTSQKQPDNTTSTSEPSSSTDSGRDTQTSSDHQGERATPIGTSESGTSSPPSPLSVVAS